MGDSKGKSTPKSANKNTVTKEDTKTTKSPAKTKNSTPSKADSSNDKNKKTPIKNSSAVKKTPVKSSTVENKTPVKTDKKTPVKDSNITKKPPVKESSSEKKSPSKESAASKKTPVKESSPGKKNSLDTKEIRRRGKAKREGLPISRVRTIMKTARYAEAISPDAVHLTAIATVSIQSNREVGVQIKWLTVVAHCILSLTDFEFKSFIFNIVSVPIIVHILG